MSKYFLLRIDEDGANILPVPEEETSIADILMEHTFVIYPGTIYCGRRPDDSSHWDATADTDDELIRLWAEHTEHHIKAHRKKKT
jgi:hypothetical protein